MRGRWGVDTRFFNALLIWQAKYHFCQHPLSNQNTEQSMKREMPSASGSIFSFFFFLAWNLLLFRRGLAAIRMNSAIPDRPLLAPHAGVPADSCFVVQAAPGASVIVTTPAETTHFSSDDKWGHWMEWQRNSYHILMPILAPSITDLRPGCTFNWESCHFKFLCPGLPSASCVVTALAPGCEVIIKGNS